MSISEENKQDKILKIFNWIERSKLHRIIKKSIMFSKILWDFKTTQTSAPIGFMETFRSIKNSDSGNLTKNALAVI